MSRRFVPGFALRRSGMWVLISALGSGVQAQTAAAFRDSAERLAGAAHALRDSLSRAWPVSILDTVSTGEFTLVSDANHRIMAKQMLRLLEPAFRRVFGSAKTIGPGLRVNVFDPPSRFFRGGDRHAAVMELTIGAWDTADSRDASGTRAGGGDGVALANSILDLVGYRMYERADSGLRAWLPRLGAITVDSDSHAPDAFYEFATSNGLDRRDCLAGRVDRCRETLGLTGDITFDRKRRYSASLRSDVLLTALVKGGEGSFARLVASAGRPIEDRLATTRGVSLDRLLAEWRAGLLNQKPSTTVLSLQDVLLLAVWASGIAVLAIGGSRWI